MSGDREWPGKAVTSAEACPLHPGPVRQGQAGGHRTALGRGARGAGGVCSAGGLDRENQHGQEKQGGGRKGFRTEVTLSGVVGSPKIWPMGRLETSQ